MNLFIIGNGFDIAHNLPTKYCHFRDYLVKLYNIKSDDNNLELLYLNENKVNKNITNEDKAKIAKVIVKYIDDIAKFNGDNWSNFEDYLGKIDYKKFLNNCNYPINDDLENKAISLAMCFKYWLFVFLEDWIKTIKINKVNKFGFEKYINPKSDYFFSFNYTKVLEDLYSCENVLHIHGCIDKELNQVKELYSKPLKHKLIIGFCKHNKFVKENLDLKDDKNFFLSVFMELEKKVKYIKEYYQDYFSEIQNTNINTIYSYGFSFSEVDLPYIKKIINSIKINKWYLNKFSYYNKKELRRIKQILKSFGFKGKVRKFHC